MAQQLKLGGIDVRVHVLALGDKLLLLYVLFRKVFRHACLAVGHVDLKLLVASSRVQHHLSHLWMDLDRLLPSILIRTS